MEIKFKHPDDNNIYTLSQKFLDKILEKGFTNIDFLGIGYFKIVLKAEYEGKPYALLIDKNNDCSTREQRLSRNFLKRGIELGYIIPLYDSIIIENTKISDDVNFCKNITSMNVVIEIEDIAKYVLWAKIQLIKNETLDFRMNFVFRLYNRLVEMFEFIIKNHLIFSDTNPGNFALITDEIESLVFIDVDSFSSLLFTSRAGEIAGKFIIEYIINYSNTSNEIIAGWITESSIINSQEEEEKAYKIFIDYIDSFSYKIAQKYLEYRKVDKYYDILDLFSKNVSINYNGRLIYPDSYAGREFFKNIDIDKEPPVQMFRPDIHTYSFIFNKYFGLSKTRLDITIYRYYNQISDLRYTDLPIF